MEKRNDSKASRFKASPDIGVDEFSVLQFVTPLPVPAFSHGSCLVHLSRDETCHLRYLRDMIRFRLKPKQLQRDVVPLPTLYELHKGERRVRSSRRLHEHVIRVLLLRIDDVFQEWASKRDARALDGVEYAAIVAVVGGGVDDLAERL